MPMLWLREAKTLRANYSCNYFRTNPTHTPMIHQCHRRIDGRTDRQTKSSGDCGMINCTSFGFACVIGNLHGFLEQRRTDSLRYQDHQVGLVRNITRLISLVQFFDVERCHLIFYICLATNYTLHSKNNLCR